MAPGNERMNMRPMIRVSVVALVVMLGASAWAWVQLPADAQVPIHWGPNGQPDDWADKTIGLFLLPAIAAAMAVVFAFIPRFEPRRANLERSGKPYAAVWIGSMVLLTALHLLAVSATLGATFDMTRIVMIGTGGFFVALGNYLPKVQPNFMMGVRTPWTLTSDLSWRKTHRLAGRLFVIAGFVLGGLGLVGVSGESLIGTLVGTLVIVLVVVFAYSYQVWRTDPARRVAG